MNYCEYPSDNHSNDRVELYHGSVVPMHLCGFHASWDLRRVIAAVRATRNP